MVFFNILRPKQTLFCPEVPVSGMFVPFDKQQCWWEDALGVDKLSSGCNWFILATFDTILRHMLQNATPFLATTALTLTSPGQPLYLLFQPTGVVFITKTVASISVLAQKFNLS